MCLWLDEMIPAEVARRLRISGTTYRRSRSWKTGGRGVWMTKHWDYPAFVERMTPTDSGSAEHLLRNSSEDG